MRRFLLVFFAFAFALNAWASFPIDLVYIWVDGNDPEWISIKNRYKTMLFQEEVVVSDASTNNRFSDNEELRYSLRSIWKFAPFVNHIYIVTMNQVPKWMQAHPKITIVDHKDIFNDWSNLPTFNSQAIESNLHHIPGLGEYFIYFNDDVFLGKPVSPSDFFTEEGLPKVLLEPSLSPSGPPVDTESSYRYAWRNTNALLDRLFAPAARYRLCHAPFALRKSFIERSEQLFPYVFVSNSSHRFRAADDYNITNGLLQYHWMYEGSAVIGNLSNTMISLRGDAHFAKNRKNLKNLENNLPFTFCIEDVMNDEKELTVNLLHTFFERVFPETAPWEK